MRLDALQESDLGKVFFLAALTVFLRLVDAPVDGLEVGVHKLQIDGLHVAHGVDGAVHVNDVVVLKAAHDVNDRVHLADM